MVGITFSSVNIIRLISPRVQLSSGSPPEASGWSHVLKIHLEADSILQSRMFRLPQVAARVGPHTRAAPQPREIY